MSRRRLDLTSSSIRALLPALLIGMVAAFPPHVRHPVVFIALGVAALMGVLATHSPRLRASGWLLAGVSLVALAANIAASYQLLRSARTAALVVAYLLVGLFCAGLPERARGWVTAAVVVSGVCLAVQGVYQSLFVFGPEAAARALELSEPVRARMASGRAVATLGLPGVLGGFLVMSLPLTAAWAGRRHGGARRGAAWVLLVLQSAGLLATRSTGAVLALAAAAAVVIWLGTRRSADAARPRRRELLAAGLLIAGMAGASLLLVARFTGPGAPDEGAGPVSLRAGNWKIAAEIFASHPILGAGAGCYGIAFPAYREWGMNESQFAHNTYLQALAEGGLAVGIPLLIAAIALAGVFLDGARSGRPFLAIACLTFLIHNLVDFTFYIPSTGFVFACLAGLAAARGEHARSYRRGRLLRGGLCLLLAGFALLVGRADAVRDAGRDRFLAGDLSGAVRMARRAVRRDPLDPDARSLLARLKLQQAISGHDTALLVSAEEEARRAVRLDPRTPHHWDLLAKVRLARSDLLGAYVAAARAAELYPIKIGYRKTRDAIAAAIPAATKAAP